MPEVYAVRILSANLQLPQIAAKVTHVRPTPLDAVNAKRFQLAKNGASILATQLGVTHPRYEGIEVGVLNPLITNGWRILRGLGLSTSGHVHIVPAQPDAYDLSQSSLSPNMRARMLPGITSCSSGRYWMYARANSSLGMIERPWLAKMRIDSRTTSPS